jgi:tetraacyldisaccharide 4'-kinase
MDAGRERWALRVISGEDRSPPAMLLRAGLLVIEPFYAAAMTARNALYDKGIFATHKLPRPTIAVGNLTTGGTGKTPLVRWLAEQLIARELRPAILMRGYRADQMAGGSDEQRMLAAQIGPRVAVIANPDRVTGGASAMRETPLPDVFVLDDAFQHRRVARDFNLLLISATNPFGYGHVLPRGLLREPVGRGVRRADAVVITRTNLASPEQLAEIERRIHRARGNIEIVLAEHVHAGMRSGDGQRMPLDDLRGAGSSCSPESPTREVLERQLDAYRGDLAGARFYADHHDFSDDDLLALRRAATTAGAHTLLTTDKDWTKIAPLTTARDGMPILRLDLEMRFRDGGDQRLMELICRGSPRRRLRRRRHRLPWLKDPEFEPRDRANQPDRDESGGEPLSARTGRLRVHGPRIITAPPARIVLPRTPRAGTTRAAAFSRRLCLARRRPGLDVLHASFPMRLAPPADCDRPVCLPAARSCCAARVAVEIDDADQPPDRRDRARIGQGPGRQPERPDPARGDQRRRRLSARPRTSGRAFACR